MRLASMPGHLYITPLLPLAAGGTGHRQDRGRTVRVAGRGATTDEGGATQPVGWAPQMGPGWERRRRLSGTRTQQEASTDEATRHSGGNGAQACVNATPPFPGRHTLAPLSISAAVNGNNYRNRPYPERHPQACAWERPLRGGSHNNNLPGVSGGASQSEAAREKVVRVAGTVP